MASRKRKTKGQLVIDLFLGEHVAGDASLKALVSIVFVVTVLLTFGSYVFAAQDKTQHLVTFAGDSIMQGTSATRAGRTVVGRLEELRPYWFVRNYSVAGASVTGNGVQWQPMNPHAVTPLLGDTIVVFLGTNDWGFNVPLDTFRTNYENFINVLEFLHPNIVCVTPIWRVNDGAKNTVGQTLGDYRAVIQNVCTAHEHSVIDGLPLVPHDAKYYDGYGLHPNDSGYAHYAKNLAKALDPLMAQ